MNTCPEVCNTCHGGKWEYGEWQPGERTWCFDWCSKQGWCGNTRTHIYGMEHDKGFGTDCRGCANLGKYLFFELLDRLMVNSYPL